MYFEFGRSGYDPPKRLALLLRAEASRLTELVGTSTGPSTLNKGRPIRRYAASEELFCGGTAKKERKRPNVSIVSVVMPGTSRAGMFAR